MTVKIRKEYEHKITVQQSYSFLTSCLKYRTIPVLNDITTCLRHRYVLDPENGWSDNMSLYYRAVAESLISDEPQRILGNGDSKLIQGAENSLSRQTIRALCDTKYNPGSIGI